MWIIIFVNVRVKCPVPRFGCNHDAGQFRSVQYITSIFSSFYLFSGGLSPYISAISRESMNRAVDSSPTPKASRPRGISGLILAILHLAPQGRVGVQLRFVFEPRLVAAITTLSPSALAFYVD